MCSAILVTGGAGYIGSHTVVELLAAGYEPIIVDNLCNARREVLTQLQQLTGVKITFYERDIQDQAGMVEILQKHAIQAVIHFAALKAVGESTEQPERYFAGNISSSISLIQAMQQAGVNQIVFSSSATVYGLPKTLPIEETAPIETLSPYGTTKIVIERLLNDMAQFRNWQVIHLRYFNPVGAHPSGLIGERVVGKPNNLLPFLCQVAKGERPHLAIFGQDYPTPDGTCVRDYIHVVDLAKAHVKALNKIGTLEAPVAYNLGTGRGYSVLELLHTFEKETGVTVPYEYAARRPGDAPACYANPALAESELGWVAERDLAEMMRDAWRWECASMHSEMT